MGKVKQNSGNKTSSIPPQKKIKKSKENKNANKHKQIHVTHQNKDGLSKESQMGVNQAGNVNPASKNKKKKNKKKKNTNKYQKVQDDEISSTTAVKSEKEASMPTAGEMLSTAFVKQEVRVNLSKLWLQHKPRSTPLVRTGADWRLQLIQEEGEADVTDGSSKYKLKELAAQILQQDTANYSKMEETGSKKQEVKFRKTVFSHGTSRDKVAAHVLRCMEAPVHSLSNLNALVGMVSAKAKTGFIEVFGTLKELMESTFFPEGQMAHKFESHNFSCLARLMVSGQEQAEKQLALWYFEDQLAFAYQRLVNQLTQVCQEAVDKTKMQGVRCLAELVSGIPGQDCDGIAVGAVVNKLGDPSRKVAALTMFHLRSLLHRRPVLKHLVVDQIEDLLYRSNVSGKAQYYCLCFLKDMIFSQDDHKLAEKLIKLYFGFFKACTKKGEVDTRLMGALLRGINRAYPYSQQTGLAIEEQLDTLYKLCHLVNFAIATQALQLIYQVMGSIDNVADRFYQVVYHQLQDPAFGMSSATSAFLNLVFKALVRDQSVNRIQAFMKRLLQVCQYQTPHVMAGILYLVSEVAREKPALATMTRLLVQTNPGDDDGDSDGLEVFSDVDEDDDDDADAEVNDSLEGSSTPSTKTPPTTSSDNRSSSPSCSPSNIQVDTKPSSDTKPLATASSWHHHMNAKSDSSYHASYDPYHRNPLYAGAQYSPLWELRHLKAHYHPSVSMFAGRVVAGDNVEYSGDPLQDFTLTRFLDRFVFKNPKKMNNQKDSAGGYVLGSKSQYAPHGARSLPVNSSEFSKLDPENVPVDDVFFHRYFTQYKKKKVKEEKEDDAADDNGSIDDDEFDEYLSRTNGLSGNDDDDDIDFASGSKSAKPGGNEEELDDEEEMDEDGDFGGKDEDHDFDNNDDDGGDVDWDDDGGGDDWSEDDMGGSDLDFDEEGAAFSDDNDFDVGKSKKRKTGLTAFTKKAKKSGDSLSSMFASAESFGHLLEENADGAMNSITTQSLANTDRANVKQIHWEVDRNRKVKGQSWRNKQRKGQLGPKKDAVRSIKGSKNFKAKKGHEKFKKGKKN